MENKRKDIKVLFLVNQCVDVINFDKVVTARSSKQFWYILVRNRVQCDEVKNVRLRSLINKYKIIKMEEHDTVTNISVMIRNITTFMVKNCVVLSYKKIRKKTIFFQPRDSDLLNLNRRSLILDLL